MAHDDQKERSKALDIAVGQIEKQFGKGSIMRLGGNGPIAQIASISTAQPAGSDATPTALRAPTPASVPNTSRINSLKPLMTAGCSLNCGVA